MTRQGRYFEFGHPHFETGVNYTWPDEIIDYGSLLEQKRNELEELLLPNLRKYIGEFEVSTMTPHYPYPQRGRQGLTLHLGDGGRWIEIWPMMGAHFIATHNLDAYSDRAATFNIGSDILEHLDPTILTPRVSIEDGEYIFRYPLPKDREIITNPLLNQETLERLYSVLKFDREIKLTIDPPQQRIENSNGTITIERGMCTGRNFQNWDIPKASFAIARIMSLSKQQA